MYRCQAFRFIYLLVLCAICVGFSIFLLINQVAWGLTDWYYQT